MMALSTSCSRISVRPAPCRPCTLHAPRHAPGLQSLAPLRRQQQRQLVCQGLFGLGLPELAVIAGVAALVFGPSKLPELGRGLGQTVKSFQTAAKEFESELKTAAAPDEEEEAKKAAAGDKKSVDK